MVRIDRKSSIEREPRTLSINQMQFARDAAIFVVNSSSTEEASRIFTEGLNPSASIQEQHRSDSVDYDEELDFMETDVLQMSLARDTTSAPF